MSLRQMLIRFLFCLTCETSYSIISFILSLRTRILQLAQSSLDYCDIVWNNLPVTLARSLYQIEQREL